MKCIVATPDRARDRSASTIVLALSAGLLLAGPANADVPTYSTFELQARSNLSVNKAEGTYNLPPDTFFANATPALNNGAQISFKISPVQAQDMQGVWFGGGGKGEIVYTTPIGAFLSDTSMNDDGFVVFPQSFSAQNGIYFYDDADGSSGFLTSMPIGTSTWGTPQVNREGELGYRAGFSGSGQAFFSLAPGQGGLFHVVEAGIDPQSPYSFLFTPSFNAQRQIAGKARLGAAGQFGENQPDHIRIFNSDGSSVLIAEDMDSDNSSPFERFDNSVSLTDTGWVAFTARLPGNVRGVFVGNGEKTIEIATESHPEVSEIEFFAPAANNNGLVAFRGRDADGGQAIFVGDGTTLVRVIGAFDTVPTDNGPAWIAQHDSSPVFGGSIAINDHGDIAFNAGLTPVGNNQIEWGSGMIIAYADVDKTDPADLNGDGVVNVFDMLLLLGDWGACDGCPTDLDGDGFVNVFDMLILLGAWG